MFYEQIGERSSTEFLNVISQAPKPNLISVYGVEMAILLNHIALDSSTIWQTFLQVSVIQKVKIAKNESFKLLIKYCTIVGKFPQTVVFYFTI